MKLNVKPVGDHFCITLPSRRFLSIHHVPMDDQHPGKVYKDRYGNASPLTFTTREEAEAFIASAPSIPHSQSIKGWLTFLVVALIVAIAIELVLVLH